MKAIGLLSGGLDSALALKIIRDMGVEVVAVKFTSPLFQCDPDTGNDCHASRVARELGLEFVKIPKGEVFIDVVRHPKHGYGSAINPCIDCHTFMLKLAKEYMEKTGASFLITGEVLNQRPMSQHRRAMDMIEREAGVAGLLVRPLSAKLLPPSEPEKNGWIDREKLFAIDGRSRRVQIDLAKKYGLKSFASPAGGCLLTDRAFASRLRDLFRHMADAGFDDIAILKTGRHYRFNGDKAICGKDRAECRELRARAKPGDLVFDPVSEKGALVLLQQNKRGIAELGNCEIGKFPNSFDFAAALTAAYADGDSEFVTVSAHEKNGATRELRVQRRARDEFKFWKL